MDEKLLSQTNNDETQPELGSEAIPMPSIPAPGQALQPSPLPKLKSAPPVNAGAGIIDDPSKKYTTALEEELDLDFNPHYKAGRDYGLGANTQEDNHVLMLSQLEDELLEKEGENKALKQKNESLKKKLAEAQKMLAEAHKQYTSIKESFHSMKGNLSEVQLINAKLLYSNKVLSDASLNERQKNKIVESLTNAESLEKVQIVYETLQSAVEDSTSIKAPKSLSEAVSRRSSSLLIKANRREDQDTNPVSETLTRMKVLAGINK